MSVRGIYRNAAIDAVMSAERAIVKGVISLLQSGKLMSDALGMDHRLDDATLAELRELRRQLAERDLYEMLYGPLPERAVDPEVMLDPWSEVHA